MNDLDTIRKRLEEHITARGLSFREVSLKIGRQSAYIHQYIKYGFPRRLSEIDRRKICMLLNINEQELMDDELSRTGSPYVPLINNDEFSSSEFINLDIYACKPGVDIYQNLVGRIGINFMEFSSWHIGNPFTAKVFRFSGDYMEPTIASGSLIIYDSSINTYCGDGLYLIRHGETVQIKRLQLTDTQTLALKSDNTRYQDLYSPLNELDILGRVTYCLSGRPL